MPALILVVDDNPLTCELICEILRSAGMDASRASASRAKQYRRFAVEVIAPMRHHVARGK